jgi:hypothetical protein
MALRLKVASVESVAPVVKVQAAVNTLLIRSALSIRIGLAAKAVKAMVRVRVAIVKAIKLPN